MPGKAISVMRQAGDRSWKLPFSRSELETLLRAMTTEAGLPYEAELELVLLSDAAMEELNNAQMGCQGPTNILSFPAYPGFSVSSFALPEADPVSSMYLGSLVLAPDTFSRECLLYGQEAEGHCLRLLAHGMAHLLGHDHGPAMDTVASSMIKAAMDSNALLS